MKRFVSLLLLCSLHCKETVKLSMQFFRHGARTEISSDGPPFPPASFFDKGQLTPVGMKGHYLLGIQMRKYYPDLYPQVYDQTRHVVYASDIPRTMESAIAHLYGLYGKNSATEEKKVDPELSQPPIEPKAPDLPLFDTPLPLGFVPIPILTTIEVNDSMFINNCKAFKKKKSIRVEEIYHSIENSFSSIIHRITKENFGPELVGKTEMSVKNANKICKKIIPRTFSFKEFKASDELILQCSHLLNIINFQAHIEPKDVRSLNTNLFKLILRYLSMVRADTYPSLVSVFTHDTFMTNLIRGLNPNLLDCAIHHYLEEYEKHEISEEAKGKFCIRHLTFASSFIFEVFADDEAPEELKVRLLFNGKLFPIMSEQMEMSLVAFEKFLSKEIDPEIDFVCMHSRSKRIPESKNLIFWALGSTALTLVSIFVFFKNWRKASATFYKKITE